MPKASTARRRPRSGREAQRTIIAVCALGSLVAAAYTLGAGGQTPSMRQAAFTAYSEASEDDLTTGSIVFVPVLGNACRKNLIDNRTWRVWEGGTVPCDQALAKSRQLRSGSGAMTRLDVIRESFRRSSP
jgi:hypothetical protein